MVIYEENILLQRKMKIMGNTNNKGNYIKKIQKIVNVVFSKWWQTEQQSKTQPETNQQQSPTQDEHQLQIEYLKLMLMQIQQQIQSPMPQAKGVYIIIGVLSLCVGALIAFLVESYTGGFLNSVAQNDAENMQKLLDLPHQFELNMQEQDIWKQQFEDNFKELQVEFKKDHENLTALMAVRENNISKFNTTVYPDKKYEIKYVYNINEPSVSQPKWKSSEDSIGKSKNGDVLKVGDYYYTPIVIPYIDGGNEVFFYGQYNENNHWNGKCILNSYNEDKLISICEAIYDDGELYSYKSVSSDSNGNLRMNERVKWGASYRGVTWTYRKSSDYIKPFLTDNVTSTDILSVDNFLNLVDVDVISYYHGDISKGLFNDGSGKAYYVGYFLPEEYKGSGNAPVIRTLYNGRFEDGEFKDTTYEAWYITRATDTKYMYFKGCFDENTAKPNESEKEENENPLNYDRILELLKENNFTDNFLGEFLVDYEVE